MIKKISEWLQELPEPYRELAIANYEKVKMHDPLYDSMEMALLCAFDWKSSNEGFEYWSDICDKIASNELDLKKQLAEVTEALRKAIVWAESVSHRIADKKDINWTYLNEARATLEATQNGGAV